MAIDDICDITANKYICASNISDIRENRTYTIKSDNPRITNELMNSKYVNLDITNSKISLTADSSNHYFWADERAHCSEKWQDWFCVPNYHNNNNVNKYPNTKTMSVGVCYNACPMGYTVSGINKCNIYQNTNDDLIYNPLAIIAIFGTHFYLNKTTIGDALENYKDINNTIGIRGSYLNDLYRVNNNNNFIKKEYIDIAKATTDPLPYITAPKVEFTGGVATGATPAIQATASVVVIGSEIKSIRMISGGSGYTLAPTVSFTGVGGSGAVATAKLDTKVSTITVDTGGSGYTIAPKVVFTGGGGNGAYAIAAILNGAVSNITVISRGNGYTSVPDISFTDGGTAATGSTPAVATAVMITEVESVTINNGGSGYTSDTTNQEKLLLKIINKFVNTGRKGGNKNSTIKLIEGDIKTAAKNFIDIYIKKIKENKEGLNKFCNKIAQYKFNINRLDTLYGKDKNEKRKLVNIIAYAYNIMCLVLYKSDTTINDPNKIKENINTLTMFNSIDKINNDAVVKVFTSACINCFKVNFRLFDNYMKKHLYSGDIMCIMNVNNVLTEKYFNAAYFKECQFIEGTLDKIITPPEYDIPYSNNLTFYDHGLLSEYSENTKYIIQILIIFGIGLAIITFICLIYFALIEAAKKKWGSPKRFKLLEYFTNFINYIFIFYNMIMYRIIQLGCAIYYAIFCKFSKANNTLLYLVCNISNILLIMFLIGYSFAQILELLNLDYIGILSKLNFSGDGNPIIPENDILNKFILCALYLYLIGTYLYCAYLVRYGLNESQFDILSNPDADFHIPLEYLYNITLSLYANNILSNINDVYTDDELDAIAADKSAINEYDKKIEEVKEEAKAEAVKAAGGAGAAGVAGVAGAAGAAGVAGIGNDGDGKNDLGNALGDFQGKKGELDINKLQKDGDAQTALKNLQGEDGKVDANAALKNLQGEDGKVDANAALKNLQGKDEEFDLGNLQGENGKPIDLKNLQGKDGEVDLNNLKGNDAQAALNKFGINFGQ